MVRSHPVGFGLYIESTGCKAHRVDSGNFIVVNAVTPNADKKKVELELLVVASEEDAKALAEYLELMDTDKAIPASVKSNYDRIIAGHLMPDGAPIKVKRSSLYSLSGEWRQLMVCTDDEVDIPSTVDPLVGVKVRNVPITDGDSVVVLPQAMIVEVLTADSFRVEAEDGETLELSDEADFTVSRSTLTRCMAAFTGDAIDASSLQDEYLELLKNLKRSKGIANESDLAKKDLTELCDAAGFGYDEEDDDDYEEDEYLINTAKRLCKRAEKAGAFLSEKVWHAEQSPAQLGKRLIDFKKKVTAMDVDKGSAPDPSSSIPKPT